ncbi:MAG: BACON domain-containing protein [Bryobacteraceae bacterium]
MRLAAPLAIVLALACGGNAAAQRVITTLAGTDYLFDGDGKPALAAPLGGLAAVVADGRGGIYVADTDNHLIVRFTLNGVLRVVAGNGLTGYTGDGDPAVSASLTFPSGLAIDGAGNLYFSDLEHNVVRRVSPAGVISTVAGPSAGLRDPEGLAADSTGNVFVADRLNHRVVRLTPGGEVRLVAGTGSAGFAGDGGTATAARLNGPRGVAVDASGNLFIADTDNHRIRRVTPQGIISTIAGGSSEGFNGDGDAVRALLSFPFGVAAGRDGSLYIADSGNQRVRRVDASGLLTTIAGTDGRGYSGDGGPATAGLLNDPVSVALDGGNVYIAEFTNNRIRRISPSGFLSTAAGNGSFGATGDNSVASAATFRGPGGLAIDPDRNLYIADSYSHRIRRIDRAGIVTTLSGTGSEGSAGDGGPARAASLSAPWAVALDRNRNLYVADTGNGRIRRIAPDGTITAVAGRGSTSPRDDNVPALSASFAEAVGLAVDAAGNIFVADAAAQLVRRVGVDGMVTIVAGGGATTGERIPARSASLKAPRGLAFDGSGVLYIGDSDRVYRLSDGTLIAVAGNGRAGYSGDGGPATAASIGGVSALAFDAAGNLLLAEIENHRVRQVTPGGVISTLAGSGESGFSGDGGPADAASLDRPAGLAVDADGNVYVADNGNRRVRIIPATAPFFQAQPAEISFRVRAGDPAPPPHLLRVTSALSGPLFQASVSTESGSGWLNLSPLSGSLPAAIQVLVDLTGLTPGTYTGTIAVLVPYAVPATRSVRVWLTVEPALPPEIRADPGSVSFGFFSGSQAASRHVRVLNRGGGLIGFKVAASVQSGGGWLSASPAEGRVSAEAAASIVVRADPANLGPGTYRGSVVITPEGLPPLEIPVTATVSSGRQTILLSQTGLSFTAVAGGGAVPPQSIGVLNTGSGVMEWTVETTTSSGNRWLSATPNSGSTDAQATDVPLIEISVNTAGLSAGDYYGQVLVGAPAADNTPQIVTVVVNVLPAGSDPGPLIRPTGLIFAGRAGSANPGAQPFTVTNLSARATSFLSGRISSGPANLFTHVPTEAAVLPNEPVRVLVQPNLGPQSPGIYRGTLTLQFAEGGAQTVSLLFVVLGAERSPERLAAGCAPARLLPLVTSLQQEFGVRAGWPVPIEARVVDDCGDAVTAGSVTASFSNGDPPLPLASLKNGRWTGSWVARNASRERLTITVSAAIPETPLAGSVQVGGTLGTAVPSPLISAEGIVNSASLAGGGVQAPGGLISVIGAQLSDASETASGSPLPLRLGSTLVAIGGRVIPLLAVSAQRIDGQIPYDLAVNTRHHLVVQRSGEISAPAEIVIAPAQPAIFTADGSVSGQGLIYRLTEGGEVLADSTSPAAPGETVVLRCAGLGAVDPPVAAGGIPPSDTPARVVVSVTVLIGGIEATVSSAALHPNLPGVYLVRAIVPQGVEAGAAVPVVVRAGDYRSLPVAMAIRP